MDWRESLLALLHWLEGQGIEAALWLVLLQALLVLLALPGPFFTAAAGFLFGIPGGMTVALLGSLLGSAAAYGIARGLPRGPIDAALEERAGGRTWVRLLRRFVRVGGWRIVLTTRLIPLFPFKLSNYFFGWLRFPFRGFAVGTALGIVPMTAVSVTAGSLASDMAAMFRNGGTEGGGRWIGSLLGLALALAAFAYAGWIGRRELRALRAEDEAAQAARRGPTLQPSGIDGADEAARSPEGSPPLAPETAGPPALMASATDAGQAGPSVGREENTGKERVS